jgi:putative transposase
VVGPKTKRKAVEAIVSSYDLPIEKACSLVGLAGSTYYYKSIRNRDDAPLEKALLSIAEKKPHAGRPYMIWHIRERLNMKDNHKRITRIYRSLHLQVGLRPKKKKRQVARSRYLFVAPDRPNQVWAMDFDSDAFASSRRFRVLAVKDLFTRKAICLRADVSIPGQSVASQLSRVIEQRGAKPARIICDNGTEFTSKAMEIWEQNTEVKLQFIQPGKPIQNAFIESFNGRLRSECLNQNWFLDLNDAKSTLEVWRRVYNEERPTKPLGKLIPSEFAKGYEDLILKDN